VWKVRIYGGCMLGGGLLMGGGGSSGHGPGGPTRWHVARGPSGGWRRCGGGPRGRRGGPRHRRRGPWAPHRPRRLRGPSAPPPPPPLWRATTSRGGPTAAGGEAGRGRRKKSLEKFWFFVELEDLIYCVHLGNFIYFLKTNIPACFAWVQELSRLTSSNCVQK